MLTRRSFLKLIGIAAASAVVVPAFQIGRQPYVLTGESVDYIGARPGGFLGACIVAEVHPWDGVGFPVDLRQNTFGRDLPLVRYYDADLANLRREVPERFWHDPANRRFNNVHTYVRVKRFGETLEEAVRHLNFVSSRAA